MSEQCTKFLFKVRGQIKRNLSRFVRIAMVIFVIGVLFLELDEHLLSNNYHADIYLYLELLIFIVWLPLTGFLLIRYMERNEKDRRRQIEMLAEQARLSRGLGEAAEWNDLVHRILEFSLFVIPVEQVRFFLYLPGQPEGKLAGCWSKNMGFLADPNLDNRPFACNLRNDHSAGDFHRTEAPDGNSLPADKRIYCLPLHVGGQQIGLLQYETPPDFIPTASQTEALNNGAVVIELAIQRANLLNTTIAQALANQEDRTHIAQDLHDTLGQNIAYLRLKLDGMLLEDDPAGQIDKIRSELTRMRDIADQAYLQVRETLAELREPQPQDLAQTVLDRARLVGQRAGFRVLFEETGAPCCLEPYFSRQVLYTLREGVNNIEKHAHATEVRLSFRWEPGRLEVTLSDNGQGFDPSSVDHTRHFGIEIMRERIESIAGRLEILARVGGGSIITIQLPLNKL
jgi:signal transduction histidine kinase